MPCDEHENLIRNHLNNHSLFQAKGFKKNLLKALEKENYPNGPYYDEAVCLFHEKMKNIQRKMGQEVSYG